MFPDVFGPFQGGFYTPEMGRLMATNPEALIPHLAAQGIAPPSGGGYTPSGSEMPLTPDTSASAPTPAPAPATQFGGGAGPYNSFGDLGSLIPFAQGPASAPSDVPAPGSPSATGAPLPLQPPAGDTTTASAKQAQDKGLLGALSGVKAPPAPPTPQIHPYAPSAPATPQSSPIAALLAGVLAGQTNPQQLRLLQAVGKEGR